MTDPLFEHIEEQERESRLALEQLQWRRRQLATTLRENHQLREELAISQDELAESIAQSVLERADDWCRTARARHPMEGIDLAGMRRKGHPAECRHTSASCAVQRRG
jgi:hypothetical protein